MNKNLAMAYRDLFIETYDRLITYLGKCIKLDTESRTVIHGVKSIMEGQRAILKELDRQGGGND